MEASAAMVEMGDLEVLAPLAELEDPVATVATRDSMVAREVMVEMGGQVASSERVGPAETGAMAHAYVQPAMEMHEFCDRRSFCLGGASFFPFCNHLCMT